MWAVLVAALSLQTIISAKKFPQKFFLRDFTDSSCFDGLSVLDTSRLTRTGTTYRDCSPQSLWQMSERSGSMKLSLHNRREDCLTRSAAAEPLVLTSCAETWQRMRSPSRAASSTKGKVGMSWVTEPQVPASEIRSLTCSFYRLRPQSGRQLPHSIF
jgi:hypothetical protein